MVAREIPAVVPFLSLLEICPIGILGQVWCLIVSIPDLALFLAFFYEFSYKFFLIALPLGKTTTTKGR